MNKLFLRLFVTNIFTNSLHEKIIDVSEIFVKSDNFFNKEKTFGYQTSVARQSYQNLPPNHHVN